MADSPFRELVALWQEKINQSERVRDREWGKRAREATQFLDGPHDFMFNGVGENFAGLLPLDRTKVPKPTFGVTVNKVAELVQILLPMIYARNPIPSIKPCEEIHFDEKALGAFGILIEQAVGAERDQRRAAREVRAQLIAAYLNYSATESNLRDQGRMAVTDALIKGRGLLWPEIYEGPNQQMRVAAAFHEPVSNLLIDPDFGSLADCLWIGRRRVMTWWQAERRFGYQNYGYPPGYLKQYAHRGESYGQQAKTIRRKHVGMWERRTGHTSDLLEYVEVYSKLGVGDRLAGSKFDGAFEEFGDYVMLAVSPSCPFFLNLPPALYEMAPPDPSLLMEAMAWPIPYWAEMRGQNWPMVELDLHPHTDKAWPYSHIEPAMGELKAIDWIASFLISKVEVNSREFIALAKAASETLKQQIEKGDTFTVLEFESSMNKTIGEMVQFLQHPPMNRDILEVLNLFISLFDQRTGLNEAMYGESAQQWRSAFEAKVKHQATTTRPGDMADAVENWMARVYKHIALAARWLLRPEDIEPQLGPAFTKLWTQFVYSASIEEVVRELGYTVEAGSGRKPNLARDEESMTESAQVMLPLLSQWASQYGLIDPLNAWLADWARSRQLDPQRYQIKLPAPATVQPGQVPPEQSKEAA